MMCPGHIGGRGIEPGADEVGALAALLAVRCAEARGVTPRFRARVLGTVHVGGLISERAPSIVVDLARGGRNVTAEILDPFLPVGSPWRGTGRVGYRQAQVLARIANDPEGTRDTQQELMQRLGGRHGG